MEAAEAEGAKAEKAYGYERPNPSGVFGRLDQAQAQVDCVSRLHAHEGAPDEDGGAVEEARDDVGQQ